MANEQSMVMDADTFLRRLLWRRQKVGDMIDQNWEEENTTMLSRELVGGPTNWLSDDDEERWFTSGRTSHGGSFAVCGVLLRRVDVLLVITGCDISCHQHHLYTGRLANKHRTILQARDLALVSVGVYYETTSTASSFGCFDSLCDGTATCKRLCVRLLWHRSLSPRRPAVARR